MKCNGCYMYRNPTSLGYFCYAPLTELRLCKLPENKRKESKQYNELVRLVSFARVDVLDQFK